MKLAFSGQGRYPDFSEGYALYLRRRRGSGEPMDEKTYGRIVKAYCRRIVERLLDEGMADLPCDLGSIAAVEIRRKPQYRGGEAVGYGGWDWRTRSWDGRLRTFGMAFLPSRRRTQNLRCYGFVANRRLFKRMKERSLEEGCKWRPLEYNDEMI